MDSTLIKEKIMHEIDLLPLSFQEKVLEYIKSIAFTNFKIEKENNQSNGNNDITSEELMHLSSQSGSFNWLRDENDIYTINDGEEVRW
jgi:hypothetical protein